MSPAEFYLLARRAADTDDEELWWQIAQGLDNLKAEIARLTKALEDADFYFASFEADAKAEIARLRYILANQNYRTSDPNFLLKPDTGEGT
jgi:hypothetical protein